MSYQHQPGYGGTDVVVQDMMPSDQRPRVGPGQVIHQEIFDAPLLGFGENLAVTEFLFRNPGRQGNPDRTNLLAAGQLSSRKQFEIGALYMSAYFNQPDDNPPPVGAPTASRCMDLLTYYTRQQLQIVDATKGGPFQSHRIGGGGGVWSGANENAGAFEKTSGVPGSENLFYLSEPFQVPPLDTFALVLEWAQNLPGGAVFGANGFNPNTLFNANTTCEKRAVFGLLGYEVRGATNG